MMSRTHPRIRIDARHARAARPTRSGASVAVLSVVFLLSLPLAAAEPAATSSPPAPAPGAPSHPDTPRGAVLGYLMAARAGDYEKAATFLDLSGCSEDERGELGPVLARQFKVVLDQKLWFGDMDEISDRPEGQTDDGLPDDRDAVGSIATSNGEVPIRLKRVAGPNGRFVWRFSPATVERISVLNEEFGLGALAEVLPYETYRIRFLEIELWQWIGLVLIATLSYLTALVLTWPVTKLLRSRARRTATETDDRMIAASDLPARCLVALVIFRIGARELHLSIPALRALVLVGRAAVLVFLVWMAVRVIDILSDGVRDRLVREGRASALSAVALGRRLSKIFVFALGAVMILQLVGFQVSGLIAGLGVGGIAVGLGAQKTVANLFGGLSLTMDQAVRLGDFCRFGDKLGTVEDVGLRSTRIRTLDRTVITVPNAEFSEIQIENFALRDRIRLQATLGLRYETTPAQLRDALERLRRLLREHPRISPDPLRVRLVSFGAYSLDVEVVAFVATTDLEEFLAVREEIYLKMMDEVAAAGTGFAFPSQTLYMSRDRRAGA